MQGHKFRFLPMFTIAGLAALALAGCGAASQSAEPAAADAEGETAEKPSGAEGEAVFSYGDTTYTVELQSCSLYESGDALFHGMAYDESGSEVGYLEGDFVGLNDDPSGEARIDFGATAKLQSMDTFVAMGDAVSHIVITDFSDTDLIVVGGVWDENGTELSTAMLKVQC